MSSKPFFASGTSAVALEREDCQRIHFFALRAAARGKRPEAIPESVPLEELSARARLDGAEVYLIHPADIERLFAGVTLAVYRTVRSLYCSRVGRSIKMVWRVLCAMACAAGAAIIPYETVLAVCLSLEEHRKESVAVPAQRGRQTWERGGAGRTLRASHCAGLLDTYLRKAHGYGPLREFEQHDHLYASLVGYGQDPAWQFPLLREFLPLAPSTINAEGVVPYCRLHYTHELLSYWP